MAAEWVRGWRERRQLPPSWSTELERQQEQQAAGRPAGTWEQAEPPTIGGSLGYLPQAGPCHATHPPALAIVLPLCPPPQQLYLMFCKSLGQMTPCSHLFAHCLSAGQVKPDIGQEEGDKIEPSYWMRQPACLQPCEETGFGSSSSSKYGNHHLLEVSRAINAEQR